MVRLFSVVLLALAVGCSTPAAKAACAASCGECGSRMGECFGTWCKCFCVTTATYRDQHPDWRTNGCQEKVLP